MDVHEEAYYYAATTMPASVGDVDETDLYDDALRSHPISTHPAEDDQYSSDPGGYADYSNKNNFGIALGIFCIGLFQFQGMLVLLVCGMLVVFLGQSSPANIEQFVCETS